MWRRAAHQHWYVSTYDNASLTNSAESLYLKDPRISGVVWRCNWAAFERAPGSYDFSTLNKALDVCAGLGKQLIARVWCNTYYGRDDPAGAIPRYINIPRDIAQDADTYGGAANRGGLYPVCSKGMPIGWGALFERATVLARFLAMLTAMSAVRTHPAFAGISAPDESTRSAWNGSGLPVPMTQETVTQANRAIYMHTAHVFGSTKVWPVINYVDSTAKLAVAADNTRALASWCARQGMNFAYSDTFRMPEQATRAPPVYFMPRPTLAAGRRVLVTVDQLSHVGAVEGLAQREIENAIQSYALEADITAWFPYPKGGPEYWAAIKAAIDVTA